MGLGHRSRVWSAPLLLASTVFATHAHAQHATEVIAYEPGQGNAGPYTDPSAALGPPTRISGTELDPSVVSPFQPAWHPSELVTIGAGGELVIAFDELVHDDPDNPFGIDLLLFGNAFFMGVPSDAPCVSGLYQEGGMVEVSLDGIDFVPIQGVSADGPFPTMGYLDAEPFGVEPGTVESDFTHPVDPALGVSMLEGMCWEDIKSAYAGSGGGMGIDLAHTRLAAIRFVRISVATDAMFLPELDAMADVAPRPRADFDRNGRVDGGDLTILLGAWGAHEPRFDLDGDGVVTGGDLTILLGDWD